MSNRRNLLLSYLSNSFKWLPYSYEYLYHSLIPTSLPAFNLFNKNATFVNAYCDGSGVFYPNSDMQSAIIEVQPNTTLYFYTNNKDGGMQRLGFTKDYPNTMDRYYNDNGLNTFNTYTNGTTIVVPDHYRYMILTFYRSGVATDTLQDVLNNLCINLSSSQNGTYKPYKELSVKNKAKVSTIYGNSVVENQLVQNGNFADGTTNFTFEALDNISVSSNVLSATATNTAFRINQSVNLVANHKYLVMYDFELVSIAGSNSNRYVGCADSNDYFPLSTIEMKKMGDSLGKYKCSVITYSTTTGSTILRIVRGLSFVVGDTFKVSNMMFIDLTQMFPFDTPTTLTDNRVQAILNRGYIAYNIGELKSVDIGEFSSEPYNLLNTNEIIKGKQINTSGQIETNVNSCYVMIDVLPSVSYTLELSYNQTACMLVEFDKDGNFISRSGNTPDQTRTINLNSRTYSVGITCWSNKDYFDTNTCFHRTGTRTGYAPYKAPQTIPFKYQGSGVGTSHDTMTINKDNVVFTKDRARTELSSLSVGGIGNNVYYASLSNAPSNTGQGNTPNIICDKYQVISAITGSAWNSETRDKVISLGYDTARVYLRDTSISQASDITGTLEYQLATPQVITIPRKHLAVVDLGSSTWTNFGTYGSGTLIYTNLSSAKTPTGTSQSTIYCSEYLSETSNDIQTYKRNKTIATITNGQLWIIDSDFAGLTNTQIQAKLSGQYLFYETENEVANILDTIDIEAGGTINANWFSWVENQLVANGNFESTSGWGVLRGNISASNNILTLLGTDTNAIVYKSLSYVQSHKYLFLAKAQLTSSVSTNTIVFAGGSSGMTDISITSTSKTQFVQIFTASSTQNINYPQLLDKRSSSWDNVYISDFMLIDITLAFGSGNEPTDINDPRIQYILNQGYIPTNTTGTLKSVDCEVLPNVEMGVKCK